MKANGVFLVDSEGFRRLGFIATGKGTHGIYPSRDGRFMYVTNRGWNTTAGGTSRTRVHQRARPADATRRGDGPVPGAAVPTWGT